MFSLHFRLPLSKPTFSFIRLTHIPNIETNTEYTKVNIHIQIDRQIDILQDYIFPIQPGSTKTYQAS